MNNNMVNGKIIGYDPNTGAPIYEQPQTNNLNEKKIIGYNPDTGAPIYEDVSSVNKKIIGYDPNTGMPIYEQPQTNNLNEKKIIGYNPDTGVPIYEETLVNNNYNQPVQQSTYNNSYQVLNNSNKQNSSGIPVVLVIIGIFVIFTVLAFLMALGIKKISSDSSNKDDDKYNPSSSETEDDIYSANSYVDNFKLYIPDAWELDEDEQNFVSPTEQCKLIAGSMKWDIETTKTTYINKLSDYNLSFAPRLINGHIWTYGSIIEDEAEMYFYLIDNDLGKYMVVFLNDTSGYDSECNNYIPRLEKSMTLEKE